MPKVLIYTFAIRLGISKIVIVTLWLWWLLLLKAHVRLLLGILWCLWIPVSLRVHERQYFATLCTRHSESKGIHVIESRWWHTGTLKFAVKTKIYIKWILRYFDINKCT